jgi:phosphonate transport system substrate-binding protein
MIGILKLKTLCLFIFILSLFIFNSNAQAQESQEEFLIGLIPEENIFNQIKKHRPLGTYLSQKLGVTVKFTVLSRYPHIVSRFKKRELDAAFFGTFTAVLAMEALDVEPVVRAADINGNMTTKGYVFTLKGSGINNIKQAKNKRMAFVDQVTATGYLYPLYLLKKGGVKYPQVFFSETLFTGSHDSAVYNVLAGKADIGAAKARIVEQLMKIDPYLKQEINIIARSEELPDNTLCVRPGLSEEFKRKLKGTLMSMHLEPEGVKVLKQLGVLRFIHAAKEDFEPIEAMTRSLGIDLKNFSYNY